MDFTCCLKHNVLSRITPSNFSSLLSLILTSWRCSEDRQFQERVGELAGWLKDRGYEESLANEQIDRIRRIDRTTLLANSGNRTNDQGRGEGVPLVATYHPALNSLGKVARRLHPMLTNSEEHRKVFPEPPLIALRRCKNLKDILVRARLSNEGNGGD